MCQVLCSKLGLLDCCVDLDCELVKGPLKRQGRGQGDAQAEVGDAIAARGRQMTPPRYQKCEKTNWR